MPKNSSLLCRDNRALSLGKTERDTAPQRKSLTQNARNTGANISDSDDSSLNNTYSDSFSYSTYCTSDSYGSSYSYFSGYNDADDEGSDSSSYSSKNRRRRSNAGSKKTHGRARRPSLTFGGSKGSKKLSPISDDDTPPPTIKAKADSAKANNGSSSSILSTYLDANATTTDSTVITRKIAVPPALNDISIIAQPSSYINDNSHINRNSSDSYPVLLNSIRPDLRLAIPGADVVRMGSIDCNIVRTTEVPITIIEKNVGIDNIVVSDDDEKDRVGGSDNSSDGDEAENRREEEVAEINSERFLASCNAVSVTNNNDNGSNRNCDKSHMHDPLEGIEKEDEKAKVRRKKKKRQSNDLSEKKRRRHYHSQDKGRSRRGSSCSGHHHHHHHHHRSRHRNNNNESGCNNSGNNNNTANYNCSDRNETTSKYNLNSTILRLEREREEIAEEIKKGIYNDIVTKIAAKKIIPTKPKKRLRTITQQTFVASQKPSKLNSSVKRYAFGLFAFEKIIIILMSFLMTTVTVWAIIAFCYDFTMAFNKESIEEVMQFSNFYSLFSSFFNSMIALELVQSIIALLDQSETHVENIVLVSVTAICRKIIILDYTHVDYTTLLGIGSIVVALGILFFFVKFGLSKTASENMKQLYYHHHHNSTHNSNMHSDHGNENPNDHHSVYNQHNSNNDIVEDDDHIMHNHYSSRGSRSSVGLGADNTDVLAQKAQHTSKYKTGVTSPNLGNSMYIASDKSHVSSMDSLHLNQHNHIMDSHAPFKSTAIGNWNDINPITAMDIKKMLNANKDNTAKASNEDSKERPHGLQQFENLADENCNTHQQLRQMATMQNNLTDYADIANSLRKNNSDVANNNHNSNNDGTVMVSSDILKVIFSSLQRLSTDLTTIREHGDIIQQQQSHLLTSQERKETKQGARKKKNNALEHDNPYVDNDIVIATAN